MKYSQKNRKDSVKSKMQNAKCKMGLFPSSQRRDRRHSRFAFWIFHFSFFISQPSHAALRTPSEEIEKTVLIDAVQIPPVQLPFQHGGLIPGPLEAG